MDLSFLKKRLFNFYMQVIRRRFLSKWIVLSIDLVLIVLATIISYSIVQQAYLNLQVHLPAFKWVLTISIFANLLCFLIFRIYQGIIRYSTIYEVQRIVSCLIVSHIIIFISLYLMLGNISGSITLTYCAIALLNSSLVLLGFRMLIIFVYQKFLKFVGSQHKQSPVFVFGTSDESISLKQVLSLAEGKYSLAGFISTNTKGTKLKKIGDSPIVYINEFDLSELRKYSVKIILFPNESILEENKTLVEVLINAGIRAFILPQIKDVDMTGNDVQLQIRPIQIEDLLGRKEIRISTELICEEIKGKNILVTGAAGSIGSEIVRQLAGFAPKLVICYDIAETPLNDLDIELKNNFPNLNFVSVIGDVRNTERLDMVFNRHKPEIVYHAAAYKHVPMMENNPCEAVMTNIYGTKLVADYSINYNVEMFVMISTDKAVNPTNVMGTSKRIAEIYVQGLATRKDILPRKIKFVTTRFGNVLGSNGSVIPLFRQQIEKGGPLTVTHPEITRFFMTIPEACRLVLEASAIGKSGHIYVFDMGKPVKIFDLAKKMIELAGLRPNIDIVIEFSGLRPGEKLYEELLSASEKVIPTEHEKILIAKVREYDYEDIITQIEELVLLSRKVDVRNTVLLMKELVPEFISQNSKFTELDKEIAER